MPVFHGATLHINVDLQNIALLHACTYRTIKVALEYQHSGNVVKYNLITVLIFFELILF